MVNQSRNVVCKELVIKASQRRAFQAFTEQIDHWWPRSHHSRLRTGNTAAGRS